jgi:hypothetical protein
MEATSISIFGSHRKRILCRRSWRGGTGIATWQAEAEEAMACASYLLKPETSVPFVYCEETRYLLDLFGEAAQELLHLHKQQLSAIIEGDQDSQRFDLLIHMANEKRQRAKNAYMRHLEAHGCSSPL